MKTAEQFIKEKYSYLRNIETQIFEFEHNDLVQMLEYYANQPKWISVKDRLPEINGHYFINDNGCEIALFSNGLWKSIGKEERGVLSDFRRTLKPTHWQPLPEKP